jgi:hypothetical protein
MKTDFWKGNENRDLSGFMKPSEVGSQIVNAVVDSKGLIVSDITINRKK